MGSVWEAEHIALRTRVAVKLIEPQVSTNVRAQERFEREARALARLRSAHVVQVLDYGIDAGVQYLVMELLHGQTLRARMQTRPRMDAHEVWTVVEQVARAMTVTHAARIVHRDLKPENIFLVREGADFSVKVLDFGISKTLKGESQSLTDAGAILGTCQYMSPEQAAGQAVDARSDLWSLGVIAFECVVGVAPFKADSVVATLQAISHGPIPVPSRVAWVPKGFDEWFARAVVRTRSRRFQSSSELAEALRPLLLQTDERPRDTALPVLAPQFETVRIDAYASTPSDRRGDVRMPSSIPVGIDGRRDTRNVALLYNASRGGALLATRRSWQPEQLVLLTLYLDDAFEGESLQAFVVRVSQRDDPIWKFEVGVRFEQPLSEALLARLEAKAGLA